MNSEIRVTNPSDAAHHADGLSIERLRTIIQDAHINFLIGAGTSVPFFEQLGDVERVLTEIHPTTKAGLLARTSVQAYFFEKVVLPNLKLLEGKDPAAKKLINSYGRFVATLNRILLKRRSTLLGKQVNLFTTNVDTALELAIERLEIDCNDGFSGKIKPRLDLGSFSTLRFRQGTRFEYQSEIPTMNLFKIHGSVGWSQSGEDIYFDHRLEGIQTVNRVFETAKAGLIEINNPSDIDAANLLVAAADKELDFDGTAFGNAYRQLSIVNPDKTKFETTVLNKTYYELLRRFANELEKENSALLVHGFSFRDEHLLDLVLRGAATNPTLQVIVFCYSRESHDEISRLFPEEKLKNGNILLVQPAETEVPGDERKLSLDVVVEDFLTPVLAGQAPKADHIIELLLGSAEGEDANA